MIIEKGSSYHMPWVARRKTSTKVMARRVKKAMKELKLTPKDVSLIGTGMSGALMVPHVADLLDMDYALLRERGAQSVNGSLYKIVGRLRKNVLFLDDLIACGRTVRRVHKELKKEGRKLVGIILYADCREFSYNLPARVWSGY